MAGQMGLHGALAEFQEKLEQLRQANLANGITASIEAEAQKEEATKRRDALDSFFSQEAVGAMRHATLKNFDPEPDQQALELTCKFVRAVLGWKHGENRPPRLFLFSQRPGESRAPGNGKSHLAVGACRYLIEHGLGQVYEYQYPRPERRCSVHMVNSAEFISEVKSTYNPGALLSSDHVISRYVWPDLLVLDDVGAERAGEHNAEQIYLLLERRKNKPTIYTSNYSPSGLERRGADWERLVSRMMENGAAVVLTGPDRRATTQPDWL